MNRGPVIFFSAFLAFAISFAVFVLAPQVQLGRQPLTTALGGDAVYPQARPGQAAQGSEVYRANGCAACHSQQVRQTGMTFDVVLTEAGTNKTAVAAVVKQLNSQIADAEKAPQTILRSLVSKAEAEAAVKQLKVPGAKADLRLSPVGPDIARGWGLRRSVAADYLYDSPVMLGSLRAGPDLANVGVRLPDAAWHLQHLYNPRIHVAGSVMPQYRFLFVTRKVGAKPSPDALVFPAGFGPKPGFEVVPTDEARALVVYLQNLRVETPLFEAPMTVTAK